MTIGLPEPLHSLCLPGVHLFLTVPPDTQAPVRPWHWFGAGREFGATVGKAVVAVHSPRPPRNGQKGQLMPNVFEVDVEKIARHHGGATVDDLHDVGLTVVRLHLTRLETE